MIGLTEWMREQIDKHKVPNIQMALWLEEVEKHVKRRIVDLKRKVRINYTKVILNNLETSNYLKLLQTQYLIIVPMDKAKNNIVFVCGRISLTDWTLKDLQHKKQ